MANWVTNSLRVRNLKPADLNRLVSDVESVWENAPLRRHVERRPNIFDKLGVLEDFDIETVSFLDNRVSIHTRSPWRTPLDTARELSAAFKCLVDICFSSFHDDECGRFVYDRGELKTYRYGSFCEVPSKPDSEDVFFRTPDWHFDWDLQTFLNPPSNLFMLEIKDE
tara:strand:+ start:2085 stop:2585 length:501 start_codon:yes stop_codon:yes gene_type:complete